ncbi:SPFH domain-containing protein [Actinophytocola sp.]|uniref:SPFH domain-containing protein n=1 Tax=Actinophytocola sp. TaxID=1872138 RepID=UPI002ED5DD16
MEKQPYPVVSEHFLAPVPRKSFWARGPHGRTADEIPRPLASQRLVYFTRGDYLLDTSALPLDSSSVMDASRVSVVDITTDTQVVVMLGIPSQDATSFTMRVTFLCTVEDPVAVVRTGGHDAEAMLSGYLKAHSRLFEVGLDYALTEINDVRRKLSSQVRAYVTVVPPEFAGMTATLASVEVLTPDELAKFQESLRDEQQKHTVDFERQRNEHRLKEQQQHYEHQREADGHRHARVLNAEQQDYERDQLSRTSDVVGGDPIAALVLSHAAGDISARELADELKELRRQEVAQDREDLLTRLEIERERDKAEWEADRLDRARRTEWAREDQLDRDKALLRREMWEREDRKLERETELKQLEAKLEVIRELGKHGHLDNANLHLDKVVNDLLGGPVVTPIAASEDRRQLESRPDGDDEFADDEKVRVEDVN